MRQAAAGRGMSSQLLRVILSPVMGQVLLNAKFQRQFLLTWPLLLCSFGDLNTSFLV